MRKFLVVLLFISILTGCGSGNFDPVVRVKQEVLELNQTVVLEEMLEDVENVGLSFEVVSSDLNVDVPGSYNVVYKISSGKKSIEKSFEFVVKDNDAPVIEVSDSIDLLYGGSFVLTDYASATDQRDGDVSSSLHFEGSINTYQIGTYKITVIANDQFNNEARKEVTINVKEDKKNTYKETICGTYTDTSFFSGQAPTLLLKSDGTFELYMNGCSVVSLVQGNYMQYDNVLYLISPDYRFSYPDEADLVRFIVQIDGTLMFDSQLELCAPNYGDVFEKTKTQSEN